MCLPRAKDDDSGAVHLRSPHSTMVISVAGKLELKSQVGREGKVHH